MRRICSLVEHLAEFGVERPGRLEVVAEGLLDHDAGVLGEAGVAEAVDHGGEERGRDLEVEDRAAWPRRSPRATRLKVAASA